MADRLELLRERLAWPSRRRFDEVLEEFARGRRPLEDASERRARRRLDDAYPQLPRAR